MMNSGGKIFCVTAALVAAGCAAEDGAFNVRAAPPRLASAGSTSDALIAEAKGLLALGNAGLATEAYRKALRQQPSSFEALAGLAECYERMGRFDLARVKYEAALAVAPRNPVLLNTFAAAFDRQGLRAEANALRAEATATARAAVVPQQQKAVATTLAVALGEPPAAVVAAPEVEKVQPSNSVTVSLPPARPADAAAVEGRRAEVPAPRSPALASPQPRLERLSLGEVALLTTGAPAWRPQIVARTQQSVTVRFVPLKSALSRPAIRLLNAARRQGLAARTREVLLDRGWRGIEIGDAPQTRARSVVLYPAGREVLARRLAVQFGFGSAPSPGVPSIVVLLGRDARSRPARDQG